MDTNNYQNFYRVLHLLYRLFAWHTIQRQNQLSKSVFDSWLILCAMHRSNWGGKVAIPEMQFTNLVCFLLFSLAGCFLILGVSCYISKIKFIAHTMAFVGKHSLSILLANMMLRRIYFLLLFRLEYNGVDFYQVNLQNFLQWWDSLGCIVFMVVVPIACILIKKKTKNLITVL